MGESILHAHVIFVKQFTVFLHLHEFSHFGLHLILFSLLSLFFLDCHNLDSFTLSLHSSHERVNIFFNVDLRSLFVLIDLTLKLGEGGTHLLRRRT